MKRQASILFNIISSSISSDSLTLQADSAQHSCYQRVIRSLLPCGIYTTEGFQIIGRQLANIAHQAYSLRQIDRMEQASQIMLALPISSEIKGIAHYYQAICTKRKGDLDSARGLLERVVKEAPQQYRARALLTIGATYFDSGKVEAALPFFLTAGQASRECDPFTQVESQRNIALIRSIHGDHKRALEDLEHLFPIVQVISKRYPQLYYSFLNSLAVELGEVGHITEAEAVCSIVLTSPFAAVYPEISQTRDELEAKRTRATPSIVAVSVALEPAPLLKPTRNLKPSCAVALIRPESKKESFQRTIIVLLRITRSILDRVRHSINPRGPPTRFQN
ncbi:MAG TPA: hypothetical protein VJZ26_18165 [Blastocatellia bacterium]|nr:hypothetical protein [Blastocatellia bacterium]